MFDSHVTYGYQEWFLVLDGEPLTDTRVLNWYQGVPERLPDLTASSGYSSSLISKLPVGELLAKFESVMVWITPNIEDHIHRVSLHRSLPEYDNSEDDNVLDPKLFFPVTVDEEHWAKPFSIVQFYDALEQVVSKHPTYRLKFDQDYVHRSIDNRI